MADTKLSALAAATSVDYLYGISGGVSKKITPAHAIGMVPLAAATISSPVEYVDLSLPAGYDFFKLFMTDVNFGQATTILAAVVSTDSGATFFNDTNNYDTYSALYDRHRLDPGFEDVSNGGLSFDALLTLADGAAHFNAEMTLFPGDSASSFAARVLGSSVDVATPRPYLTDALWFLNPNATVPPTYARATTLRIQPWGNGTAGPPTSGKTIASGSYHLFGAPTP